MFLPTLTSLKYVHVVNKRPYISCANNVEMWDLEGKKSSFFKIGLRNPILGQLRWNKEKYN